MKPSKYTFFTSLLCASGLSAGLCFCVMTSFAIPADGLSLVCACVLAALLFSALLLLPKSWVWLLTVAALAGGGLYIRRNTAILRGDSGHSDRSSDRYFRYGCNADSDPDCRPLCASLQLDGHAQ